MVKRIEPCLCPTGRLLDLAPTRRAGRDLKRKVSEVYSEEDYKSEEDPDYEVGLCHQLGARSGVGGGGGGGGANVTIRDRGEGMRRTLSNNEERMRRETLKWLSSLPILMQESFLW